MAKRKGGLHKKVSSIFDGVPLQRGAEESEEQDQQPQAGAPARPSTPARPAQPARKEPSKGGMGRTSAPVSPPPSRSRQESRPKPRKPSTKRKTSAGHETFIERQKRILLYPTNPIEKKQRKQLIVMPVLIILFVAMFPRLLGPPKTETEHFDHTKKGQQDENFTVTSRSSRSSIDWDRPDPLPSAMNDPMHIKEPEKYVPPPPGIDEKYPFIVKSTLIGEGYTSAVVGIRKAAGSTEIVSTKIAHEGDVINGATVIEINDEHVIFQAEGEQWTVMKEQLE